MLIELKTIEQSPRRQILQKLRSVFFQCTIDDTPDSVGPLIDIIEAGELIPGADHHLQYGPNFNAGTIQKTEAALNKAGLTFTRV